MQINRFAGYGGILMPSPPIDPRFERSGGEGS